MKTIEIECCFCNKTVRKPTGEYNRAIKNNSKMFCGKKCSGKWRTKFYVHKPKSVPEKKDCKTCKKSFPIERFPKTYNKWYLNICQDCFIIKERKRRKADYEKNKNDIDFKEKRKKTNYKHYYKNITKSREYSRNWFKTDKWKEYKSKNKGRLRERARKGAQYRVKALSDGYVKGRMRSCGIEIPKDPHTQKNAVELYRIQILISRLKRKTKKYEK